jgi:hypothetical protein
VSPKKGSNQIVAGEEATHMGDPTPHPDTGKNSEEPTDRRSTTRTTRWQKVVGIIGLVVVGFLLFGGGGSVDHGPGQNPPFETENGGGHAPPPGIEH